MWGCGDMPQMLVADAGYPNVPWLLTPFPGHHLNPVESSFNTSSLAQGSVLSKQMQIEGSTMLLDPTGATSEYNQTSYLCCCVFDLAQLEIR